MPGNAVQIRGSDGAVRVKDSRVVIAGNADPCCCSGPGTCYAGYIATLNCDAATGAATGWTVSPGSPAGWGTSWYDLNPGFACSSKGIYVAYSCGGTPTPPSAPSLPAGAKCNYCFDITLEFMAWYKEWINGILCVDQDPQANYGPTKVRVKFEACGKEEPVTGTIISGDPGYEWVVSMVTFAYAASSDTLYLTTKWSKNFPYIVGATCPEKPFGCTISMVGPSYADGYVYVQQRQQPGLSIGEYMECLGRAITDTDVGEEQLFQEITVHTVTLLDACNQADKKCYYTKTATCTEVAPGTWVWIPGSITGQCLDAAPGPLDTWTLVSGRTYQIIRESGTCTGAPGDCTSYSTETPAGVIACP